MDNKRMLELAGIEPKEIILLNESPDEATSMIENLLKTAKEAREEYKKGTLDLPEFVDDVIKQLEQIHTL